MRFTSDDRDGTVNDFTPCVSGPVPCSDKSIWQRINRFERLQRLWEGDVKAIGSVDADLFEEYAYHPCPINCEQYFVSAGVMSWSETQSHKRRLSQLRTRLRDLLRQQDRLWDDSNIDGNQWTNLELEIATCREALDYEKTFGEG